MRHITNQMINACAGATNIKTITRRLRDFGGDAAAALAADVKAALKKRAARAVARRSHDRLLINAALRPQKLAQAKRVKAALSAPTAALWRSDFREKVATAARIDADYASEARLAILELACREAKKRGWAVRHTSAAKNGRASSRYIAVPGLGEARVSDHDLPDTAERQNRRDNGGRSRWDGEIVIGANWRCLRLETLMRQIILAAAGRGDF